MATLLKLLANTDYDVQQHVGDILKPIRTDQRKEAHKKMFFDTLDELDDLHLFYREARIVHDNHDSDLASFPLYLKHLDHFEAEGTTGDYFPMARRGGWGTQIYDPRKGSYFSIRNEINSFSK